MKKEKEKSQSEKLSCIVGHQLCKALSYTVCLTKDLLLVVFFQSRYVVPVQLGSNSKASWANCFRHNILDPLPINGLLP